MKNLITKLVICVFFLAGLPDGQNSLYGQDEKKEQTGKKKRRPPTKKPVKKRPTSKKKKPTSSKKKRKPSSKKSTKKRPTSKRTTSKKRPPQEQAKKRTRPRRKPVQKQVEQEQKPVVSTPKPPEIDVISLSNEFNTLTDRLESSSAQLAHATSYLQPFDRKKVVKIENRGAEIPLSKLEDTVFKSPDNREAMRELGLRYEAGQRFDDAKDVYLRSIAKDPLNPDNHYFLGRVYQSQGELLRAQMAYEEALDLDPNHKATLNALGTITGDANAAEMSQDLLNRSAIQQPNGVAQEIQSIQKLIYSKNFTEALSKTVTALNSFPNQSNLLYLQGVCFEETGQTVDAKKAYQSAIHADPQNVEAHLALANHYYSQGKYIYAAMAFGDVVMINPGDTESRYMQGLCYFNATEWKRCTAVWEQLLRIQPNHPLVSALLPQTYYILAVEYNRQGDATKGRNAFQNAIGINPNTGQWLPGSYRTLGKYYREKGMYKESLAAYQETVELRPSDSFAYLGMGITYWRMSESLLAKAAWERSLELNPGNNEARGWLIIAENNK